MGEREQLVADIRAAIEGASPGPWSQTGAEVERSIGDYSQVVGTMDTVGDAALVAAAPELLVRALALLEPEEPARPEQCPSCWSGDPRVYPHPCADPWHFGGEQ